MSRNYIRLSILITLVILNYSCFCSAQESDNSTTDGPGRGTDYFPGIGTWYGDPTGAGSGNTPPFVNRAFDLGGACGLAYDVKQDPYFAMIAAGSNKIFKGGAGCGTCYEVKCKDNAPCSRRPVRVTITDQCPGCDGDFHFDLSGAAFGALAKPGRENDLRSAGRINLQYRRVKCHYNANIKFRIDPGSNPSYLAFAVENLNGYGDIAHIEGQPSNQGGNWLSAQFSWGVTWKLNIPQGVTGPYSIRITGPENTTSVTAYNVIPYDWAAGKYYYSNVNFS